MTKLYDIYCVISDKKVRKNEKFYKRYSRSKTLPGTLVKTNRGYFIDGQNVDQKAVETYIETLKCNKS